MNTYLSHFDLMRSPTGLDYQTLLGNSTRLANNHAQGLTTLTVPAIAVALNQYDRITIFDANNSEVVTVEAAAPVNSTSITISPLQFSHAVGTPACSDNAMSLLSLADQIVDASDWIEDICNQSLWFNTWTEILPMPTMEAAIDNQMNLFFRPRHFPVLSVTSIQMQSQQANPITFDATQAFIDANQQYVRVPTLTQVGQTQAIWPGQPMNRVTNMWLTITYTAGFQPGSLPNNVRDAAILLVSEILSRRQNPTGADQINLGGKNIISVLRGDASGETLLVKNAKKKLARYIRRAF